jgi:oligopeptide/dipeptide ABC transporter ATP-binding protein
MHFAYKDISRYSIMAETILKLFGLKTYFFTAEGIVKAVDGIDVEIKMNETLGVVGESGCGKSVMAYSILRLVKNPPGRIVEGGVFFAGNDLLALPESEMQKIRGNQISMIFQEPMTSLNPVITVGKQISETIRTHQHLSRKEAKERTTEMLDMVGIALARKRMKEFPYQMSGGMRQRVMIAMALACKPQVLIADEPTTALDVTIQAQILDLIQNLKQELGTAVVLITHNMGIISEVAQQVLVMYLGLAVEKAPTREIFDKPLHPYTQGLLGSIPHLGARLKWGRVRLKEIPGSVPSPFDLSSGCRFYSRCQVRMDRCKDENPEFFIVSLGHEVRCWNYGQ